MRVHISFTYKALRWRKTYINFRWDIYIFVSRNDQIQNAFTEVN